MADSEHNDFFDALDNAKEHASDMAAMLDEAKPVTFSRVAELALQRDPDAIYDLAAQRRIVARDLRQRFQTPVDALRWVLSS